MVRSTTTVKQQQRQFRRNPIRAIVYVPFFLGFLCAWSLVLQVSNSNDFQTYMLLADSVQRSLSEPFSQLYASSDLTSNVPNPGNYEPVSCSSVLDQMRQDTLEIEDPNKGAMHGKQVETDSKFWISLHNQEFDATRWGIHQSGHYYEKSLTKAFQDVLKTASAGSCVLDVGGNIGFFTLLSAAHAPVTVDTFEPNPKNRLRVCESLHLNQWHSEYDPVHHKSNNEIQNTPHVNLYPYGVGRDTGVFQFEEHSNPGMGKFKGNAIEAGSTASGFQVINLDSFARERGWFESIAEISILKVDVEGSEYSVIEGARELLSSGMVKNIFMEVSARTRREEHLNLPALNMLAEAGYKLHKIGGWSGPNKDVPFPQDEQLARNIMEAAKKEPANQLNLWWTR